MGTQDVRQRQPNILKKPEEAIIKSTLFTVNQLSATSTKISWDKTSEEFQGLSINGYKIKSSQNVYCVADENAYITVPNELLDTLDEIRLIFETEENSEQKEDVLYSDWVQLKKPSQNSLILISRIAIVLLISLIFLSMYYFMRESAGISNIHSYNSVHKFKSVLENSAFRNQESIYMNMLRNAGSRHLENLYSNNDKDLRPMSFLVAGFAGNMTTMECFVKLVGDAFTSETYTVINSSEFVGEDSKKKLDERIVGSLKGRQKFVIVRDINQLSFDTAQLFMTYSDEHNELATYPQSVILLTTTLPFEYKSSSNRHLDEGRVESYFLKTVWKEADRNDAAALWSRVGDGIVLIKPEQNISC